VGGLDPSLEELYVVLGKAVGDRGYSFLFYEGLGQEQALRNGLRFRAALGTPDVLDEPAKIVLIGMSMGRFALRAAAFDQTHRRRAGVRHAFDVAESAEAPHRGRGWDALDEPGWRVPVSRIARAVRSYFWKALDTADKIIVVTAANAGIGFATAHGLAMRGARVVLVCRDLDRGKAALAAVGKVAATPPSLFMADFARLSSVRDLARSLQEHLPRIDVLINNAGAAFARRELTTDGIERTFAVNHLAPFLLTNLVLDLIHRSSAGRIVNLTAGIPVSRASFWRISRERSTTASSTPTGRRKCPTFSSRTSLPDALKALGSL
jgi:hypothetical protein